LSASIDPIPLIDLRPQYDAIGAQAEAAVTAVMRQGSFILGPEVAAFEREFAEYLGVPHCIGVASGTGALEVAMQALGIGLGDEVILPANTFIACAFAISHLGAKPVFVDMDDYYTIDAGAIETAITARTKAVMAVHLYGNAADMPRIVDIARRYNIAVIEDVSQAHGARLHGRRLGTFGDVAAFSFYPAKNLGAFGDGGAIATADAAIDDRVRLLRDLGQRKRHEHLIVADNCRLDSVQAAVLRIKLRHLDEWNERRREAARRYTEALAHDGLAPVPVRQGSEPVYQYYVINVADRARVLEDLVKLGVGAAVHHPTPIHRQPAYAHLGIPAGTFPKSETTSETVISLPMFPGISDQQIDRVVAALRSCALPAA
jgi:dTDP-4-amino-4,6-dideoxygalactose transaminase